MMLGNNRIHNGKAVFGDGSVYIDNGPPAPFNLPSSPVACYGAWISRNSFSLTT